MYVGSHSLVCSLTVFKDTKKIDQKDEKIIRESIPLIYSAAPLKYICSSGRERHPNSQDICTYEFVYTPKTLSN